MSSRRIAVVTGSRAEYGLLAGLMGLLAADPRVELQVVVTGMHLEPRFGDTVKAIERDGFAIAARVPILEDGDSELATACSVGRAVIGLAEAFERLKPSMVVVLGDRTEILGAAQAAMLLRIPLAHIHGGEATEGAVDDMVRHAITKMAQLHFVAADAYARRVIQMGEDPARVHMTGAPGLDALRTLRRKSRAELGDELGFDLGPGPLLLVTYHPVTMDPTASVAGIEALLRALETFPQARIIITGVNSDAGRDAVAERIAAFAAGRVNVLVRDSLGQVNYLSAMAMAAAIVGNSSSGIIEAPALGVPTVNIGPRQGGRLRAASVIDCPEDQAAIAGAITRALDPAFRAGWPSPLSLYGEGDSAARIAAILAEAAPSLVKPFRDLGD
jgi:UDP-hydrolysing UDP-N-acetyl-D-glucosamine 2-epimerase